MESAVFLGRYEVIRPLGEGGMGRVYLARQRDRDREVVVKVMHPEVAGKPKFRDLFKREMVALARLQHPNAVAFIDGSLDDPSGACLVMEYVPGKTLAEVLVRERRLSPERVLRLLEPLCDVLQTAHDQGAIHCDLKPANIMVVDPGLPQETIKVMDFGLARLAAEPYFSIEKIKGSGLNVANGTPEYICPEQVRGEEMDHRGDLYSVGVILYEVLAGRRPYEGSMEEILLAHADKIPPRFADFGVAWVPATVESVVRQCLNKHARERPQTARELADRFHKALGRKLPQRKKPTSTSTLPANQANLLPASEITAPGTVADYIEAWMPEQIAVIKLRGFVEDAGGELVDSIPGLLRVRFGPASLYRPPSKEKPKPKGLLSLLGLQKEAPPPDARIDVELHMRKKPAPQQNTLGLTVLLRPLVDGKPALDHRWEACCDKIRSDLRAYFISKS